MNPKVVVPRVKRYVNKAMILKVIEDRKKPSITQSGSPFESPRVPNIPQQMPTLDAPASAAYILGTSDSSVDRPLKEDRG